MSLETACTDGEPTPIPARLDPSALPTIHPVRWLVVTILAVSLLLMSTLFPLYELHSANTHADAQTCHQSQKVWDTLTGVINTAYRNQSLSIDPSTLPPETQRLLAELRPLLQASAGRGSQIREDLLKVIGPRPVCS